MVHTSENIQTSLLLRFHVLKQGYKTEEIPNIDILNGPEKNIRTSLFFRFHVLKHGYIFLLPALCDMCATSLM